MEIFQTEFILYVKDISSSVLFYSKLLNRKPDLDVPGMKEFSLSSGVKLGLMPEQGIARIITPALRHPAEGTGIPRCELYLLVEDADDAYIHGIRCGGIPVSAVADRDWGHRVGYFSDHDGHVIAVANTV